jgi:hypothetical protein
MLVLLAAAAMRSEERKHGCQHKDAVSWDLYATDFVKHLRTWRAILTTMITESLLHTVQLQKKDTHCAAVTALQLKELFSTKTNGIVL